MPVKRGKLTTCATRGFGRGNLCCVKPLAMLAVTRPLNENKEIEINCLFIFCHYVWIHVPSLYAPYLKIRLNIIHLGSDKTNIDINKIIRQCPRLVVIGRFYFYWEVTICQIKKKNFILKLSICNHPSRMLRP